MRPKGLDRSTGPSHPQKIASKFIKFVAGIAKSATTPAHVYWSLIGSCHSNQAITHLKKRSTARFNLGSMDPRTPIGNRPIRAVHLSRQASHAGTGSTHPRCKPQPTGVRESPCTVSEPPRPKESPYVAVKSVSTDNPKDGVHPSSPRKLPPHLGWPEATPEMWKPPEPTPPAAD